MTYSDELYQALKAAFPKLTHRRLDVLWHWVIAMPRGRLVSGVTESDLLDPDEVMACLYLAREYAYWQHDIDAAVIKSLSAKRKRSLYPGSYLARSIGDESEITTEVQ